MDPASENFKNSARDPKSEVEKLCLISQSLPTSQAQPAPGAPASLNLYLAKGTLGATDSSVLIVEQGF